MTSTPKPLIGISSPAAPDLRARRDAPASGENAAKGVPSDRALLLMQLRDLAVHHNKQARHFEPFGATNALTLFHDAACTYVCLAIEALVEHEA
jgi:hypothetical protein